MYFLELGPGIIFDISSSRFGGYGRETRGSRSRVTDHAKSYGDYDRTGRTRGLVTDLEVTDRRNAMVLLTLLRDRSVFCSTQPFIYHACTRLEGLGIS